MPPVLPPKLRVALAVLATVLTALAGAGLTLIIDPGPDHPGRTVTVHVGTKPTPPAAAAAIADARGPVDPSSSDLPGISAAGEAKVEKANDHAVDAGTYDASGVLKGATAQPAHLRCLTTMHGAYRPVSQIGLGVVHVTVGPNTPGLGDVHGLCHYFAVNKLSATWIVDNEANSAQNVALTFNPWTQAFFNQWACSIEFVGYTGRPGEGPAQWTEAQLREGARLMASCFKVAGIPIRDGAINRTTGRIVRTGVISHQELGPLGGNHSDPGPAFDRALFLRYMREAATGQRANSEAAQAACDRLNWHRRRAHVVGHWFPTRRARAGELAREVRARRGHCPSKYRR